MAHIESRTETYMAMLRGGAGFFTAREDVTAAEFHDYVERLRVDELFPGIQGIGFSLRVNGAGVAAVEQREHALGRPSFRVWPEGPREEIHTILYLEPADERNAAALGYDMFTEPTRRAAMERARDGGRPAASGLVRLVQEIDSDVQPGFLIYVPVYSSGIIPTSLHERRENLVGFVYAPFRARDLFESVFRHSVPQVSFTVYDGSQVEPSQQLYRSPRDTPHRARHMSVDRLSIAGRRWTIAFESTGDLEAATNPIMVPGAFVSGLLLSLLLAGIVHLQRRNQLERERLLDAERAAREESERVGRMKDEFLATLSHELRTPLTAILGWAELLRGELSREEFETGLEVIQRNAETQAQLINDLLDMSRIISGKIRLDIAPTDLLRVTGDAIEVVRPMADPKQCDINLRHTGRPRPIFADAHRMQQVIWNLLTNAVKFSPQGRPIDVTVHYLDEGVQIDVQDRGSGIEPKFLPHVFDRFRQADSSSTRRHMGLGIGLSIVKSLVELHGGFVEAHSAGRGLGALFCVRLPERQPRSTGTDEPPPPAAAVLTPPSVSASLVGIDILLVEDERDSRELIVNILRNRGANVRATSSAEEALDRLQQDRPSIIVSDIGMPGMDGYAFIRKVRGLRNPDLANTPAIALTAFARAQDRERALEAGYQMHIVKPVAPAVLTNACASLLEPKVT